MGLGRGDMRQVRGPMFVCGLQSVSTREET